jgi:hypothetical protein
VVWCSDPPLQRPWDHQETRSHRDLQTVLRGVGARSRRLVRKARTRNSRGRGLDSPEAGKGPPSFCNRMDSYCSFKVADRGFYPA